MTFNVLADINVCAQLARKLYEYGFSKARNASLQYNEFGQDVYRLHESLLQLSRVFQQVEGQARPGSIPQSSEFFNTSALNSILDEPFQTIRECKRLLQKRNIFAEHNGFISNVYWNVAIESDVTLLHNRIKFHNVRVLALLKPLEIKLLLDIRAVVVDYGEAILAKLSELTALEARFFGETPPVSTEEATRCEQIQIPDFLRHRFEDASKAGKPELTHGADFAMNDGINAFLTHHSDDAIASTFSGYVVLAPTQSPEQYLRMMKATWIIQAVQSSAEYGTACSSGNRLLKCFVEGLAEKCLNVFKIFANTPPDNPFRVRNEPDEATLSPLGEEAFAIWPKVIRPLDRFDAAITSGSEEMKIVLRAPLQHQSLSSHKELLLLRHDITVFEMITKEIAARLEFSDSQSKHVNLKVAALNPIYADPNIQYTASVLNPPIMDLCLYPFGMNGPNELLSFRAYKDLYQFQEAITGYRPVLDLQGVELSIQQDNQSKWAARVQLWSLSTEKQHQPRNNPPISPIHSNRRDSRISNPGSRNSSSNQNSHPSSVYTFQSTTTQTTTITSMNGADNSVGNKLEAEVIESPKEPVLVLFLRPRRQRTHLPHLQFLSLMRIPIGEASALLQTSNCACRPSTGHQCKHLVITGAKKIFGNKPLMVQWHKEQGMINLALLGAHHKLRGTQEEEKVIYTNFTFKDAHDRLKFGNTFHALQKAYAGKMGAYDEYKRSLRLRKNG